MLIVPRTKLAMEAKSLYQLMFSAEKTLKHPVQIEHDDWGGKVRHANTADIVGYVRKVDDDYDIRRELAPPDSGGRTRHDPPTPGG